MRQQRHLPLHFLVFLVGVAWPSVSQAQLSLSSAMTLALHNSPRVKIAEDDVRRSRASLAEMRDAYLPTATANGGAGSSYGITLSVPTIFTINLQSLVFSSVQRDYVKSARLAVAASALSLEDARAQVEEDTAVTYLLLDHEQAKTRILAEEYADALRLVAIVQQRVDSGMGSQLELQQARRTPLEIKLRLIASKQEQSRLSLHLSQITGVSIDHLSIEPASLSLPDPSAATERAALSSLPDSPQLRSSEVDATAKQVRAAGDAHYMWRPQVSSFAQYGRVSPINDVSDYYNLHGNYNTAVFGLQVQFPFFDSARRARANESAADALHATHESELLRSQQLEDRAKLVGSFEELETRVQLAEADQAIAQEQLKATLVQLKTGGYSGSPMTPKDELRGRINERQMTLDLLDARLELQKSRLFLMRQTGTLEALLR